MWYEANGFVGTAQLRAALAQRARLGLAPARQRGSASEQAAESLRAGSPGPAAAAAEHSARSAWRGGKHLCHARLSDPHASPSV